MLTALRRLRRPATPASKKRHPIVLTRTVACPWCGAAPHVRCTRIVTGGYQDANHEARIAVAGSIYGHRAVA